MAEQRKGKLLAADKSLMKDGTHYSKMNTFTDKQGNEHKDLYYYFDLTWDNGDKGSGKSKTTEGSFKIGDEYSYEKGDFTDKSGNTRYFFTKLNNLSYKSSHGGGSSTKSPEQQKQIMNQVAFKAANSCRDSVNAEYLDVFRALREWLYTKVMDEGENSEAMSGIIKIVGKFYEKEQEKTSLQNVLKLADYYLKETKNTSWKEASQTNGTTSSQISQSQPQGQQAMKLNHQPTQKSPTSDPSTMEDDDLPF